MPANNISNSDKATLLNIQCRKGDSFERTLTFKTDGVVDVITGHVFKMHVKDPKSTTVVLSFEIGSGASIVSNKLVLSKTGVQMDAVPAGNYKYDLKQIFPDGKVRTRLGGNFIVNSNYTS